MKLLQRQEAGIEDEEDGSRFLRGRRRRHLLGV
jgi:hypothetical protein